MNLHMQKFSLLPQIKYRGFICPCGKSYLSNAALYTHIKQKHNGKAPGQILKPKNYYFKRGRPISKANIIIDQNNKLHRVLTIDSQEQLQKSVSNSVNITGNQEDADEIIKNLCTYLKAKQNLSIKKYLLNQIQAFIEMSVYLRMDNIEKTKHQYVCLADGVSQFLKQISQEIKWENFQHVFIFFIVFLQYLLDEYNDKSLLWQAPLDITCQNVNYYMQQHMKEMSQHYQLSYMWVFQEESSTQIFNAFFKWIMLKNYSQYKVIPQNKQINLQSSNDSR